MTNIIHSDARLGFALAYVQNVLDPESEESNHLSDSDKKLVATVHDHYVHMAESPNERLFQNIPSCACSSEDPYLLNNIDFYIAFLLVGIDEENESVHKRIVKHLNDCFWCFELFTDVLRDFYHASEKFKNQSIQMG